MASAYFTVVTDYGVKEMLKAVKEETKVNITEFAVGDGGGSECAPSTEQTGLVNEVWRGAVNTCYISGDSENLLIVESVIPSNVGGFTIREMGLFDEKGGMIAVCNTPDTQKVKVSDGVVHELDLSMELALTNTDSVQLVIDPNVVVATKKDLERATAAAQAAAAEAAEAKKAAQAAAEEAAENAVTVTPELTDGTKIATIEVGEDIKEIFAPDAGGGSVIKGIVTEETLYLKKIYAKKGNTILAEATINIAGQFTLSGITETGEITVTATDGTDTAETTVDIKTYSLYEVELSFYTLYGFHITDNEANPDDKLEYITGCDNEGFTPAKMNYTTGEFEPGSWVGKHQWFFPKPCMLKYDGTVAYYLNPDDYTQKEDGTPSDVANADFGGNAMMEWGQHKKKIWIKIVPNPENVFEGDVYICDKQLDENFHAWSFYNNQDVLCDHFYTAIYNGAEISGKLRSLSGKTPIASKTAEQEITLATANNTDGNNLWYTETHSDRFTVNMLLLLMCGTTDTKKAYGNGNIFYNNDTGASVMNSGTMDKKGLFWGSNSTTAHIGVKVFGMEHWWANQWRRIAGYINDKGTQKIKMTYGKADGSTVTGYNTTGSGYHTIANSTPDGTSGGYTNKMIFHAIGGMIPKTASGSETTHYTDGNWFNNAQVDYAFVGGNCYFGLHCGALCSSVDSLASHTDWTVGATLSCKQLAAKAQAAA